MDSMFPPLAAFMVQLGSRHLSFQFTDVQKKLFGTPLFQTIVLFFVFYNSTKKPALAIFLTMSLYLVIFVLLNDAHPHNLIPRWWLKKEGFKEKEGTEEIYEAYLDRLHALEATRRSRY